MEQLDELPDGYYAFSEVKFIVVDHMTTFLSYDPAIAGQYIKHSLDTNYYNPELLDYIYHLGSDIFLIRRAIFQLCQEDYLPSIKWYVRKGFFKSSTNIPAIKSLATLEWLISAGMFVDDVNPYHLISSDPQPKTLQFLSDHGITYDTNRIGIDSYVGDDYRSVVYLYRNITSFDKSSVRLFLERNQDIDVFAGLLRNGIDYRGYPKRRERAMLYNYLISR